VRGDSTSCLGLIRLSGATVAGALLSGALIQTSTVKFIKQISVDKFFIMYLSDSKQKHSKLYPKQTAGLASGQFRVEIPMESLGSLRD
jgi:hypothetical protein